MDIARLPMDLSAQRVQDQVSMAVMGKALDFATEQSASLAKMLEAAAPAVRIADPALGRLVDLQA
jgi:hypothetical protein